MTLIAKHNKTVSIITITFFFLCIIGVNHLSAQVTIGSSITSNHGALLDLKERPDLGANSSKGILLPRMSLKDTKSLYPIFEDKDVTETIKKQHIGLTIFNLNEDLPNNLCKGLYVWTDNLSWERLPEPCCLPLTALDIENNYLKEDFSFASEREIRFKPLVTPQNASTPISHKWYLDGALISEDETLRYTFPKSGAIDKKYNLRLEASNLCSSSIISEKTVKIIDCAGISDDSRIRLEGESGQKPTVNETELTFTITDLEHYTPEQLKKMGVSIEWYYHNNGWNAPEKFTLIDNVGSPSITIFLSDARFNQSTVYIGFIIKGSANVLDCPLVNDKSNGIYQLLVRESMVSKTSFTQDMTNKYVQEWNNFKP